MYNGDWIFFAMAQNQTNQILKQHFDEMKIKKFDLNVYYSLKAQNEKVAKEYLKYWERIEITKQEEEKQRQIEEQKGNERMTKYVIAGVIIFIVLLITTILCAQNC